MGDRNDWRAPVALALGILCFFRLGPILAVPAVILGSLVTADRSHPQYGMAAVGRILGIINLVLFAALVAFGVMAVTGLAGLGILGSLL